MGQGFGNGQASGFAGETLGERIVRAARLAAAMHLYQAVNPENQSEHMLRQRVAIGGAGPVVETIDPRWEDAGADAEPQLRRTLRRP